MIKIQPYFPLLHLEDTASIDIGIKIDFLIGQSGISYVYLDGLVSLLSRSSW